MVTHTGLNLFLCTVCGKCYTGNKQLPNHLKILEHGELLCTQCGYLTLDYNKYKYGMLKHSKTTIHLCPHCEYVSTIVTSLRSYILTHTGEKSYKCPDPNCDYASTQIGPLQRHIKRIT